MSTNPFRELRKEKNPSLMEDYKAKDLAKDLGIPAPKISELENNKRDASLTELKAYHKYFNVPYECKFCPNGTPILKLAVHPF